jgi:hypothetical protein
LGPPPDLDALRAEVRSLTAAYKVGDPAALDAFRDLASLLLNLTVLDPSSFVRLIRERGAADRGVLGGPNGPTDPLELRDGRFLRLAVSLYIEPTDQGPRLKVLQTSYQYQADRDGTDWIFRYEYLRHGSDRHPPAHLQVRAIPENHWPWTPGVGRVHFPTGRVPLEAVIRLLVEEFSVPCQMPNDVWRPVLAASEQAFQEIAHRPLSGPGR